MNETTMESVNSESQEEVQVENQEAETEIVSREFCCKKCHKKQFIKVSSSSLQSIEDLVHYAIALEKEGWTVEITERAYDGLIARLNTICPICRLTT